MYVLLGRPKQLTSDSVNTFDSGVLQQMRVKIERVLSTLSGYDDQPHVEPQLRVYQPGVYSELRGEGQLRSTEVQRQEYMLHFSYGSHRVSVIFPSSNVDTQTTRRAVNRLLEEILQQQPDESESHILETIQEPAFA